MSQGRRVVFDTSTLVSAALRSSSIPDQALSLALQNAVICVSQATLEELHSVLAREKFDRYLGKQERLEFVSVLRRNAWTVPVRAEDLASIDPSCRDRKDNAFLALAAVSEANVIVSSDEDLLILHPWRGIPIMTPAEFLSWYDLP